MSTIAVLALARFQSGICVVPGEGLEPSKPEGRRILSPLRLPFRHPGTGALRNTRTQHHLQQVSDLKGAKEAAAGMPVGEVPSAEASNKVEECLDVACGFLERIGSIGGKVAPIVASALPDSR